MGLMGLILASLVNLWFQNGIMSMVLSAISVLIFTGLTAWDTQQIKEMYYEADDVATMMMVPAEPTTLEAVEGPALEAVRV